MSDFVTPIDLLKDEFNKYKRALSKSTDSALKGEITETIHQTHMDNLIPKIAIYKEAIEVLVLHNFKK
jgi:hypothetical protein